MAGIGTAHLAHVPHFVYRCFDEDGRLLYVGCTANLNRRFTTHRSQSRWSSRMATVALIGPFVGTNARRRAMARETEVIAAERPLFNLTAERWSLARHRAQTAYLHANPERCCGSNYCRTCNPSLQEAS